MNPAVQPTKQFDAALKRRVRWTATDDAFSPYEANVDGTAWQLRLNDFPAEPLYSLLIDQQTVGDLDDWPGAWART